MDIMKRSERLIAIVAVVCLFSGCDALVAQSGVSVQGHSQGTVEQATIPLPPMGWGSWNSFANSIDAQIAMQQAKALVSSGLKAAGYKYMLLDEGWWLGKRDEDGNIVVDPQQWPALKLGEKPGDMSNIVRYIHSLGLKAGTYTDAGMNGCSSSSPDTGPKRPFTGSEGHYDQDFLQFAKWGFDYVKVDWCGGNKEHLDPAIQYAEIARAIKRAETITGHHMLFSICDWGRQSPWTWAPGIGGVLDDMWRTGGDITNPIVDDQAHAKMSVSLKNVFSNFDAGIHPEAQHTGYYNDLDMMVLGMRGMTETSDRVHMSLWAISGAPMIVGADIAKLSKEEISILTNSDVIAVHQDALGLQGIEVAETAPGLQVWAKPLRQPGRRAVVLLNRTNAAASISVDWSELGLAPSSAADVRDLWAQKDLGSRPSGYTVTVPADDVAVLVVSGRDGQVVHYQADSRQNEFDGGAAPAACGNCSDGQSVTIGGTKQVIFKNVESSAIRTFVQVTYTNVSGAPIIAELRVNGQDATKVAFPPTTGQHPETIALELNLKGPDKQNVLDFSASCSKDVALESIAVSAW